MTTDADSNERAELQREREDPEISPAQPLGPGRIDDDKAKPAGEPEPDIKSESGPRMRH